MAVVAGSNIIAARVGEVAGFYGSMAEELTQLFKRSGDVAWTSDMPVRAKTPPKYGPSTGRMPSNSKQARPQAGAGSTLRRHFKEEPSPFFGANPFGDFPAKESAMSQQLSEALPAKQVSKAAPARRGAQPRSGALGSRSAGRATGNRLQLGQERATAAPSGGGGLLRERLTSRPASPPRSSTKAESIRSRLQGSAAMESLELPQGQGQRRSRSPRSVALQTSLQLSRGLQEASLDGTALPALIGGAPEPPADTARAKLVSVSDLQLVLPQDVGTAVLSQRESPPSHSTDAEEAPLRRLQRPTVRSVIAEIITEDLKSAATAAQEPTPPAKEDSAETWTPAVAMEQDRLARVEGVLMSQAEAASQQMQAFAQMQSQTLEQIHALLQAQSQAQSERMEIAALARALSQGEPRQPSVDFATKALELQQALMESSKEAIDRMARLSEQQHAGLAEKVAASVRDAVQVSTVVEQGPPVARPSLAELFAGVREILADFRSQGQTVIPSRARTVPPSPSVVSAACSAMRPLLQSPSAAGAATSLYLETEPPLETEERAEQHLIFEEDGEEEARPLTHWPDLRSLLSAFPHEIPPQSRTATTSSSSDRFGDESESMSSSVRSLRSRGEIRWTELLLQTASPGEVLTPVSGSAGEAGSVAAASIGEALSAGEVVEGKLASSVGQLSDSCPSSVGQVADEASLGEVSGGRHRHRQSRYLTREGLVHVQSHWPTAAPEGGARADACSIGELDSGEVVSDVGLRRAASGSVGEVSSEGEVQNHLLVHAGVRTASVGEVSRDATSGDD
mmetsp:Transcript_41838/g.98060  ORF Transcript_41838/g.98060 Transcript_41838/m.98060 type:complete len:796 (-) Transcript_41838:105-2492(-)